ncbi:MAG TPA: AAA family ATPase [Urbifossiella sp.]|jgi:ATP-dependent Clp protease ATP-binding subunit ClpA|nr:AAA family ATPase [Urbifossiella sp.]
MRFRVPIYVAQSPAGYTARPLFAPRPTRTDDNLNRLLTKLVGEIVRAVEFEARAHRQDEVARWAFAPPLAQHRLPLEIELRRRAVKGKFLFVTFDHLGRRLAFTPSVPDVWFEVARGEQLADRARAALEEHWRTVERDADDPEGVDPAADALKGKAWVQVLDVSARVPAVVRPADPLAFLMIGGGESPDGAAELRRVGRCLDWLYPDELDRAVLRAAEAAELGRLLAASDRRPVLLVGPRQVGKTAVVHECVFARVAERRHVHVQRGNVWLVAPQRLISGMSYVGQWEGRLLAILRHARKRDHVLYFDDLVGLFLAGVTSQSGLNAAVVLKPYLEDRAVRVLGEITPEGLRVLRERDRGFADQFHVLPVREPTDADTLRTLVGVQRRLEGKHECSFGLDALPAVIDAQRRYDRAAAFPGKAAAVLTRLAAKAAAGSPPGPRAEARTPTSPHRPRITRDDVLADVAARSGLSLAFLDPKARLDRDDVRDRLAAQVVGQPEAAEALADVVSVAKARLNDPGRPLAAFLFVGPTGVGKTEMAKAAARVLFGTADRLVRFDLNEFNQPGAAARLVGSFARPEGLLTAAIRRQPFAVILLDEVEKADPGVFDLLLQLLGEGRLTDALGRTADFTNAIVILTSNLGVREAEGRLGFGAADDPRAFVRAAERFFRPEFFNRLDRIVPFGRLARGDLAGVARRLVDGVLARGGFAQRGCVLDVTAAAVERVIDAGYDPALGARAMKRAVERELTRPAAAALAKLAPDELTVVTVRADGDRLAVDVRAPGWAPRAGAAEPPPAADRVAAARVALGRATETVARLRPPAGMVSGRVTADQERYFALKEFAREVAADLDRIEERTDSETATNVVARQLEAIGRKSRYRALKVGRDRNRRTRHDATQPFRSLLSAVAMEEAVRELLELAEPADSDAELFELEGRLALLALMAAAPADDRPTYLWGRGFPAGGADRSALAVLDCYRGGWADGLGIEAAVVRPPGLPESDFLVEIKGFHARPLAAAAEAGTHLLLPKHGGSIPVRVDVIDRWPADLPDPAAFAPVVRVYPAGQPILDVRSGLIAPPPFTPDQLRMFTLAALPRG